MVGREVSSARTGRARAPVGDPVLVVEGLSAAGDRGAEALRGVSLTVRAGEILAVAGVAGNGQRELAETITGMRPPTAGSVTIEGRRLRGGDAREAIRAGIAHVPEDRLHTGVAPSLSIASNFVLKSYRGRSVTTGPLLRLRTIRDHAASLIERYDVRGGGRSCPRGGSPAETCRRSCSRASSRASRACSSSRRRPAASTSPRSRPCTAISAMRPRVASACCSSREDLDEIRALADRIAVVYEGAIVGEVDPATATVEEIGLLMAGGHRS